jgi:cysteate synthase
MRLIADGRFGKNKMKLMVSQNIPFIPIHNAWKADSRQILPFNDDVARKQIEEITAKVLSNRKPPYSIFGGLYDALKDTNGDILLANNAELEEASKLFEKLEGIDIHPAAAVATATLIKAAQNGEMDKNSLIMLNITGGGEKRYCEENELHFLKPDLIFKLGTSDEEIKDSLQKLY